MRLGDVVTFTGEGETVTIRFEGTGTQTRTAADGGTTHIHLVAGTILGGPRDGVYASWRLDDIADIAVMETAARYAARWEAEVHAGERRAAAAAGHAWDADAPERGRPAYDRAAYEQVCTALDVEVWPDDHPTLAQTYSEPACDRRPSQLARTYLTWMAAARRWRHIQREREADTARRAVELAASGLGDGPLDRAGYEQACSIMGVSPLPDKHCLVVENERAARRIGAGFTTLAGLPYEGPAAELAERRGQEILQFAPPVDTAVCDECGAEFARGTGMNASLGLACDVDCYDAMADRPGRHATAR